MTTKTSNQQNNPHKAVAYARFSSEHQREESIDAQLRVIRDYADKNGIIIVHEYIDRAISARSDQRPEFQKMIADAKKHGFSSVIVHKLDRFSRDRYDSAHYRHELKKHGVAVRSVIENLDDSPESVILQSVIEGMNEYYSRNLARETMKGLKENALNGKHTGGSPPLGYRVNPETKRIEIDENEAQAVKLIFELAGKGIPYAAMVDCLNARGYRTKRGAEFNSTSLHDILVNQKYIGICIYNKRVSPSVCNSSKVFKDESEWIVRDDVYPPLVDRALFDSIRQRIKSRRMGNSSHSKEIYLLSGKIRCGVCGRAYCGEKKRNGKGIVTYSYFCNSRNRSHTHDCSNPMITRNIIEGFVLQQLSDYVFSDSAAERLANSYNRYLLEQNSEATNQIQALKKEISALNYKISSTVDMLIEVKSSALKQKLVELEARKSVAENELELLTSNLGVNQVTLDELEEVFAKIRRTLMNGTLKNLKRLIDIYVHEVVVYPERVVVTFNLFPDIPPKPKNKDKDCPEEGQTSDFDSFPAEMTIDFERSKYIQASDNMRAAILNRIRDTDNTNE